jgi:LytS/YehU family sensor histidine kinase
MKIDKPVTLLLVYSLQETKCVVGFPNPAWIPAKALLRIVDDAVGVGPEQQAVGGMGFTNIRERLMALDGTLKITSAPTKGTIIEGSVPLKRRR